MACLLGQAYAAACGNKESSWEALQDTLNVRNWLRYRSGQVPEAKFARVGFRPAKRRDV